jgi:sulfoxide reductase heme-binding subunit YedZ
VTNHLFWITSRAAGIAALVLASLAVSVGLIMSLGLLKRTGSDRRSIHEMLSLATIVAIVVHATALLGDKYLHPSLADISIPFVSGYKSGWMTLGIVSGWALIVLGLTYYVRGRIGVARWRAIHRFTALAWLGGLGHSLGEGTDAGQLWFLAMIAVVAVPALLLLIRRHSGAKSAPQWSSASASSRSASPISPAREPSTRPSGGGRTLAQTTMSSSSRRAA